MNNNDELCSDWLFHSAAYFSSSRIRKETQGKYIFQYFLAYIETTLKYTIVYTMERQYLRHILQDQMLVSGAQDLLIIRHHPQSSLLTLFMW